MAIPLNSYTTYVAGIPNGSVREDLHNIIYDISPTDTPVLSMAQQGSATSVLHEWLTDVLEAASTANAQLEGDDITAQSIAAPVRLQNICQISNKSVTLSGTEEVVNNVGSNDELARQVARRSLALKRDMEAILTGNQASNAGSAAVARTCRSLEAWYPSANSNRGVGGVAGSTTQAATDASTTSQRAIKETYLKDVLQKVWVSGGKPNLIVAGAINKQRISGFSGNANREIDADSEELIAAIDIYSSDFGFMLQVVPDRFSRGQTVHVLETEMLSVDYLRKFYQTPLAKTGDSEKRLILAEYTLRVNNPLAHGVIADLTVT